jgi:aspartyl-tRNA synthetase
MTTKQNNLERTDYCAAFSAKDEGHEVMLMGWVNTRRDLGSLIFIDLRDRSGIIQLVFNPEEAKECHEKAKKLRQEFVIAVKGIVKKRDKENINAKISTGEIEIAARELFILNEANTPPFAVGEDDSASEELKLKYRYLQLRHPRLQRNLMLRHKLCQATRHYLSNHGFIEVETPFLTKSTPEGARDYLIPSRIHPGNFYALPQSPQLFKQLLMISGYDKYFQIVKCFRDEDLRANRQPEFTQIDIEMSFIAQKDVFKVVEGLMKEIFSMINVTVKLPFPRISYQEAMDKYGTDKPDLRFSLEIKDITEMVKGCQFQLFSKIIEKGGCVKGINLPGKAEKYSSKKIDKLGDYVKSLGAGGLIALKLEEGEIKSPILKYLGEPVAQQVAAAMNAEQGDIILLIADKPHIATEVLGALRLYLAEQEKLANPADWKFVWITDFPLLEIDEEGRLAARHHPFTSPKEEDIKLLETEPMRVGAQAYDLVLNGEEIGGGSIRIHRVDLQRKVFKALGITEKEAQEKFGFLLEALQYGAPPHGGIALGLDRIAMFLCGEDSIRQVIGFPKTTSALCLMTDSPSPVSKVQLDELSIYIKKDKN